MKAFLCRISAEGEAGERGEAAGGGKENARLEARSSGTAADVRALIGLGLLAGDRHGPWNGVPSSSSLLMNKVFIFCIALVDLFHRF